jgi:hypothetical protein
MILAFLAALLSSRAEASPNVSAAFVGCYSLTLSSWEPRVDLGRDAVFVSLPTGVRLLADQGTDGPEKGRSILRSLPAQGGGAGPFSFWHSKSRDQLVLVWTSGFAGVTATLNRDKSLLRGFAKTFWDFPRQVQNRSVVATPINCPGQ